MSRIMRSFYAHAEKTFSFEVIEAALDDYKADLDSFDARIQMRLSFPDAGGQPALGPVRLPVLRHRAGTGRTGRRAPEDRGISTSSIPRPAHALWSSANMRGRCANQLATPHSQRSVARLSVELAAGQGCLWFEDLIDMARAAVPTETQVMVKARGRAGLRRAQRCQPDLRGGCHAPLRRTAGA